MNRFLQARQEYEAVPIPKELDSRVRQGIRQGKRRARLRRGFRAVGNIAACLAVTVGVLNLSPTAAKAAADVPVLGGLFQVLTVRHYEQERDQVYYQAEVPEIESQSVVAQRVNQEIQERVDAHLEECRKLWEEYREAFLATGGTEEQWAERTMDVKVDYEVKSQTDTTVSFVVNLFQGSFSAYNEQYYYNLDLENDRDITLQDLLGEDWVDVCNRSIQEQIDASADEEGFSYFFPPEDGGFVTVDEATPFYIREDGEVVVAFPRYAIAAGAAGSPEFVIDRSLS